MLRQHREGLRERGRIPRVGVCSDLLHWSRVTPRRGVTLVHRGRFGGNARKRKAKLTDATFNAMIGVAVPAEGPVATIEQDDTDFVQGVITVDLPAVPRPHADTGRPALARE